jgi:hypothetical protein
MADLNMADFYDRVRKFEKMRDLGHGFEAANTLGRSFYQPKAVKRRGWLLPILVTLLVVFGVKAALYQAVGAISYEDRVARLQAGTGFDAAGGWLMQADPVTLWLSEKIDMGLDRLK